MGACVSLGDVSPGGLRRRVLFRKMGTCVSGTRSIREVRGKEHRIQDPHLSIGPIRSTDDERCVLPRVERVSASVPQSQEIQAHVQYYPVFHPYRESTRVDEDKPLSRSRQDFDFVWPVESLP